MVLTYESLTLKTWFLNCFNIKHLWFNDHSFDLNPRETAKNVIFLIVVGEIDFSDVEWWRMEILPFQKNISSVLSYEFCLLSPHDYSWTVSFFEEIFWTQWQVQGSNEMTFEYLDLADEIHIAFSALFCPGMSVATLIYLNWAFKMFSKYIDCVRTFCWLIKNAFDHFKCCLCTIFSKLTIWNYFWVYYKQFLIISDKGSVTWYV